MDIIFSQTIIIAASRDVHLLRVSNHACVYTATVSTGKMNSEILNRRLLRHITAILYTQRTCRFQLCRESFYDCAQKFNVTGQTPVTPVQHLLFSASLPPLYTSYYTHPLMHPLILVKAKPISSPHHHHRHYQTPAPQLVVYLSEHTDTLR